MLVLRRGENRSSRRKTSRSRVENQQTQPTYDAGSGNRTRDTLVEGERSHHCANPAALFTLKTHQMFPVHKMPGEFNLNATVTSHFGFVFEKNPVREIT